MTGTTAPPPELTYGLKPTATTDHDRTPEGKLAAGDVIHFLESVTAWSHVYTRGQSVTLDADMIRRTINARGVSWLDQIDAEGSRIGRGEWPATAPRWTYGDPQWQEEREEARRRAWAIEDPEERARAREAVDRAYGPAPSTSRTIGGPTPEAKPTGDASR